MIRLQSFQSRNTTHQRKFRPDSFYSPRDIRIQGRMTRLKHRRVVSLSPNEQIGWVYASNIQDRMYRDLDWEYFRLIRPFVGEKSHQLNSVTPFRVSETTFNHRLSNRCATNRCSSKSDAGRHLGTPPVTWPPVVEKHPWISEPEGSASPPSRVLVLRRGQSP